MTDSAEQGSESIPPPKKALRSRWLLLMVLVPLAFFDGSSIWVWVAYGEPEPILAGFQVSFLRSSLLPGKRHRVPLQPCPACQRGGHSRCTSRTKGIELDLDFSKRGSMRLDYSIKWDAEDEAGSTVDGVNYHVLPTFLIGSTPVDADSFECPCCETETNSGG